MPTNPAVSTLQADTETVRVTRWDLPPSSDTGLHRHEFDYVVIPITDGELTVTSADGETITATMAIGGSYVRPAGVEHNVANLTDQAVAFVEVELLEHPIP